MQLYHIFYFNGPATGLMEGCACLNEGCSGLVTGLITDCTGFIIGLVTGNTGLVITGLVTGCTGFVTGLVIGCTGLVITGLVTGCAGFVTGLVIGCTGLVITGLVTGCTGFITGLVIGNTGFVTGLVTAGLVLPGLTGLLITGFPVLSNEGNLAFTEGAFGKFFLKVAAPLLAIRGFEYVCL